MGIEFADGQDCPIAAESVGKDPNAIGPDSLSGGGPVEMAGTEQGQSANLEMPNQAIPGGGEIESPVDK